MSEDETCCSNSCRLCNVTDMTRRKVGFNKNKNCKVTPFRRVHKISTGDYWLRHVCPSVLPPALKNVSTTGRIVTKFDTWHFFFWKFVDKTQVTLKSDKNNAWFTWRRFYVYDISLNSFESAKSLRQFVEEVRWHFIFNKFFFPKIVPLMTTWKNLVQPDRPQITIWHGAWAQYYG